MHPELSLFYWTNSFGIETYFNISNMSKHRNPLPPPNYQFLSLAPSSQLTALTVSIPHPSFRLQLTPEGLLAFVLLLGICSCQSHQRTVCSQILNIPH